MIKLNLVSVKMYHKVHCGISVCVSVYIIVIFSKTPAIQKEYCSTVPLSFHCVLTSSKKNFVETLMSVHCLS